MTENGSRPDFSFRTGDTVLVTGAASGIGRACSLRAAEMGLDVVGWDLNGAGLEDTARAVRATGRQMTTRVVDVGDDRQVDDGFAALAPDTAIRYLVNNAGPPSSADLSFDEGVGLCVGSMRRVTERWLSGTLPPGAALVNLASVAGNVVGTASDWYTAAKAAIAGFTRYLAAYRADVVRSNAVAPGMVDTPRLAGFAASDLGKSILGRVPMGRIGQPDDIAYAILFLLSPLASYIDGAILVIDGGWTITQ